MESQREEASEDEHFKVIENFILHFYASHFLWSTSVFNKVHGCLGAISILKQQNHIFHHPIIFVPLPLPHLSIRTLLMLDQGSPRSSMSPFLCPDLQGSLIYMSCLLAVLSGNSTYHFQCDGDTIQPQQKSNAWEQIQDSATLSIIKILFKLLILLEVPLLLLKLRMIMII